MRALSARRAMAYAALGLVLVATTGQSSAAKTRVCQIVKDGPGDAVASFVVGPNQSNAPSIDIISADVATDAKYVAVAIRVSDITARNPHIQAGEGFDFSFARKGGDPLIFRARKDALGAWTYRYGFRVGGSETFLGDAGGTVETRLHEIRIWVEQATLGERAIRAGLSVIDFTVKSYDTGGVVQFQDTAPGDGAKGLVYTAGALTCVPLGK